MSTITVRINRELKERMKEIRINWSEFVREAIRRKVEEEERRRMGEGLLNDLDEGKHKVPSGFINKTIREMRGVK